MAKTGKDRDMEAADHPASDPARMPDFSEALALNPLLAQPAAAMAAAVAIGFGIANQMAGIFFGALQGVMETANRQTAGEEVKITEPSAPAGKPAAAEQAAAEPVAAAPAPVAERPKAKPARKAATPVARKKPVPAEASVRGRAAPKTSAKAPAGRKPAVKASAAAGIDDLKRISGIGPKLEAVLNGMGVTSFAQVAAWNDADIARFDKELGFEGRIRRDEWVGQAKALLK